MIDINLAISAVVAALYLLLLYLVYSDTVELPTNWDVESIFILYKTENGLDWINRVAQRYKRFWRSLGTAGYITGITILISSSIFVIFSAISVILNPPPESQVTSPTNYVVIPGVNDFLPLSVGLEIVIGLALGMIVHEGGHAILSRAEGIELDSTGLVFFSILPMGAFVEPVKESQEKASRTGRLRMFAAGITNNIILTVVSIVLLIAVGSAIMTPVAGAAIGGTFENSPLAQSGIEEGDVIVSINGNSIESNEDFQDVSQEISDRSVTVVTESGKSHSIDRFLLVEQTVESPLVPDTLQSAGSSVNTVNGKEIYTVSGFERYTESVSDSSITISTDSDSSEFILGGLATIQDDSNLLRSTSNLESGDDIIVTSVNGQRTQSASEVRSVLEESNGAAEVTLYTGEETVTREISEPKLGVVLYQGYSGVSFTDIGASLYPVESFFGISDPIGTDTSVVQWTVLFFFGPFATLAGLQYNFFGFAGINSSFYTSTIGLDPFVFFAMNVFFWTAWININLAVFNCIPTYMLDGGHILKDGSSILGEKLGFDKDIFSTIVTKYTKITLFASLLIMILLPII